MSFYEAHITVKPKTDVEELKLFCQKHNYKVIDIRLDKGKHKRQLMITCKFEQAKDITALHDFSDAVIKTQKHGFDIIRKKLESSNLIGGSKYFEAHWKIVFDKIAQKNECQNWLKGQQDLYASSNGSLDKLTTLYTTVRHKDMDDFHKLCEDKDDILREHYTGIKFHNERVIIDSNPNLDSGWVS